MVAVTYGAARAATPHVAGAKIANKTGKKRKSIFVRVFDAIAESQLRRAEREIARYHHLLPRDFDFNGDLRFAREEKSPFGGW